MPIDPRIPLGIQNPQIQNPLEMLSTITQIQGVRDQAEARRLAAEEAREKKNRQARYDRALQEATSIGPDGRPTLDFGKLFPHVPAATLFELQKTADENATRMAQLQSANLGRDKLLNEYWAGVARSINVLGNTPDAYGKALTAARMAGHLTQAELDALNAEARADPTAIDRRTKAAIARVTEPKDPTKLEKITRYNPATGVTEEVFVTPTEGATYTQPPKAGAGAANLQAKEVLLDGRPAFVSFNPDTGTFHLGGQDVTARVRPVPPPNPLQLVSVLGADGKPVLVPEGQAVGKTPGSAAAAADVAKLPAAIQSEIATMLTAEQMANDVAKLGAETNWACVGPVEGRIGATPLGSGGAKGETLRNQIGNIQATIALMRGGTSFTDTEKALLETYTPTTTDTDAKIKTKLANLVDFIQKKRANVLRVASGEYTLPPPAADPLTVTAPNGKTYTFKSAAEAAAFKKRAGIQ